jgi:hypothetical protein
MLKVLALLLTLSFSLAAAAPALDTDALLREAFPPSPADESVLLTDTASPADSARRALWVGAAPGAVGIESGIESGRGHGHGGSETPEAGVIELAALGAGLLLLSQALRKQRRCH